MKKVINKLVVLGLLVSCHTHTQYTDGDGNLVNSIRCGRNISSCYTEARRICNGDFEVIGKYSNDNYIVNNIGNSSFVQRVNNSTLEFMCEYEDEDE